MKPPTASEQSSPFEPTGGASPRAALVAEGDGLTATLVTHRLQREGFSVTQVQDGAAARDALARAAFVLVVLDVRLPGVNGFELLRLIRAASGRQPAVLLFSSSANEQDLVRGFELGADDYILKPFSPVEFVARTRRLLRIREEIP